MALGIVLYGMLYARGIAFGRFRLMMWVPWSASP